MKITALLSFVARMRHWRRQKDVQSRHQLFRWRETADDPDFTDKNQKQSGEVMKTSDWSEFDLSAPSVLSAVKFIFDLAGMLTVFIRATNEESFVVLRKFHDLMLARTLYAEGVTFQSPGSAAQPRHPGLTGETIPVYAEGVTQFGCNAFSVKLRDCIDNPGCATRPRAVEFNRFAVKTHNRHLDWFHPSQISNRLWSISFWFRPKAGLGSIRGLETFIFGCGPKAG
jgi:hypothetical protein